MKSFLKHHLFAFLACAIIPLAVFTGQVDFTFGDNNLSLLTSQSILAHGSIKLDPYFQQHGKDSLLRGDYGSYLNHGGHDYYYFPVGTPLLSVPIVAVANLAGQDMVRTADVETTRRWVCAITLVLLYLLLYAIARAHPIPQGPFSSNNLAALLALLTVFGTSAASIMATGNWSHNFATVLIALVLHLLLMMDRTPKAKTLAPWLLGLSLFLAYLCRPTAVVWVVLALGYLLLRNRSAFFKAAVVAGACMGLFVLWSHAEYGQFLPPYYRPGRITAPGTPFAAMLGNLFSPTRGLFIYSPFVLLGFAGFAFREFRRFHLHWVCLAGILLHLVLISRFNHWWGGWSYGPRLQTESIPALFILVVGALACMARQFNRRARIAAFTVFGLLVGWSCFVHTYQGLYRPKVKTWNSMIDIYPEQYIWEWEYPQFLAGTFPETIMWRNSIYQAEYRRVLQDVPEGTQFFFPGDPSAFPHLRRLTRRYNRQQLFGDYHLFNDWHNLKPGLPVYTNLLGSALLKKDHPEWPQAPAKEYRTLGQTLADLEGYKVFVAGNCVDTTAFAPSTKDYFRKQKADILKPGTPAPVSWILIFDQGKLRIQKTPTEGPLTHDWFHMHYYAQIRVQKDECWHTPYIRIERKVFVDQGPHIYVVSLDDKTGEIQFFRIANGNGLDIEAEAVFKVTVP